MLWPGREEGGGEIRVGGGGEAESSIATVEVLSPKPLVYEEETEAERGVTSEPGRSQLSKPWALPPP